jgi:hypothetical protein
MKADKIGLTALGSAITLVVVVWLVLMASKAAKVEPEHYASGSAVILIKSGVQIPCERGIWAYGQDVRCFQPNGYVDFLRIDVAIKVVTP